jgi:uncharacterized membrane protein
VLPLLLPLPGLLKNRMYTYRWLSLLVWLYFAEGVVRATSDAARRALATSSAAVPAAVRACARTCAGGCAARRQRRAMTLLDGLRARRRRATC